MYIFCVTNIFQFVSKIDLEGLNRSIQIINFQFHERFFRLFVTGEMDSLLGWVLGWMLGWLWRGGERRRRLATTLHCVTPAEHIPQTPVDPTGRHRLLLGM